MLLENAWVVIFQSAIAAQQLHDKLHNCNVHCVQNVSRKGYSSYIQNQEKSKDHLILVANSEQCWLPLQVSFLFVCLFLSPSSLDQFKPLFFASMQSVFLFLSINNFLPISFFLLPPWHFAYFPLRFTAGFYHKAQSIQFHNPLIGFIMQITNSTP